MPNKPDIHRLMELQKLLLKFRAIERVVYVPGSDRPENDTEHSYDLAMTAWFLAGHFPELDRDKLIRIALVHDLVEIYAGDTFVYGDAESLATKQAREEAALTQLKQDWPDFGEVIDELTAYEDKLSEEAKFVYALDKVMPTMMAYLTEGQVWRTHNISMEAFRTEKEKKIPKTSPIYDYYLQLVKLLEAKPEFFPAASGKQR